MKSERHIVVKVIPILRMDCPTCILVLENEVKRLKGVEDVRGNYMAKTLRVAYDPNVVQLADIERAIEHVGYQVAYKKYPGVVSRIRGLLQRERQAAMRSISDAEFPGKVLHASKPVAVLFSSPTCPTCRVLKPIYEKAAEDIGDKAELYEMDITSTDTWRRYDIMSTPTILIFREGKVKDRLTSLPEPQDIEGALIGKAAEG
jgi:thioredoxin 1